MPEPIRVRVIEFVYQDGQDVQKKANAAPYSVKDSVNISKQAYEKFRAQGRQQLIVPPDGRDEKNESRPDPAPERDLNTPDLNSKAKREEIRKAYLEAVKKYHPDKFSNHPPELMRNAEEKMKQINAVYCILRKA